MDEEGRRLGHQIGEGGRVKTRQCVIVKRNSEDVFGAHKEIAGTTALCFDIHEGFSVQLTSS